jgi:hypothetical protein
MVGKQVAGGQIHAPRNSFTKRSFGRDLSNLQQPHDALHKNQQIL